MPSDPSTDKQNLTAWYDKGNAIAIALKKGDLFIGALRAADDAGCSSLNEHTMFRNGYADIVSGRWPWGVPLDEHGRLTDDGIVL